MNKNRLLLLICLCFTIATQAQGGLERLCGAYFRSNPYKYSYSQFVPHLINDPTLKNTTLTRRSADSLFYFGGEYTTHKPFDFPQLKTEISLREAPVKVSDTLSLVDTIIVYTLTTTAENKPEILKAVQKQAERIHRKYRGMFATTQYMTFQQAGIDHEGGVYNYYAPGYGLAPFAVTWEITTDKKEIMLSLIFRIKVYENEAGIPFPFYN
jgi:hypothetical protein